MGFWDDEYYEREPSEVELIFDEAKTKLVEQIKDSVRAELEAIKTSEEVSKKWMEQYKKDWKSAIDENAQLRKKIDELQDELEQKRASLKELNYNIGDTIYYVRKDYSKSTRHTCITCGGKGQLYFEKDGLRYSTRCPDCMDRVSKFQENKYVRETSTQPYVVRYGMITKIDVEITDQGQLVTYRINDESEWFRESDISTHKDKMSALAQQNTNNELEEALTSVGRKLQGM